MLLLIIFAIFFCTTHLFAMDNAHPQNQSAISKLPTDHKQEIMQWLPLADQQSLASTCKLLNATTKLHARTLQIMALQPWPRRYKQYESSPKLRLETMSQEILGGLFWPAIVTHRSQTATWPKSSLNNQFFLPLVALITIIPIEFRGIALPAIHLVGDLYENIRLDKKLSDYITINQRIAECFEAQRITTDVMHINYYSDNQAHPLMHAVKEAKIPAAIIDVYRGCTRETLTPFSIINHNESLKRLELIIKNENVFCPYDIDADSVYAVLEQNNSLEELCLSNITPQSSLTLSLLLPKLLSLIFTKKNMKKLSLYKCHCDNGPHQGLIGLSGNNTLEEFSLAQCCWLSDYTSVFLDFMKGNTQLKSLRLQNTILTNESVLKLAMSERKPIDFIVTRIEQ